MINHDITPDPTNAPFRPNFPMNADDTRIAAREDEALYREALDRALALILEQG